MNIGEVHSDVFPRCEDMFRGAAGERTTYRVEVTRRFDEGAGVNCWWVIDDVFSGIGDIVNDAEIRSHVLVQIEDGFGSVERVRIRVVNDKSLCNNHDNNRYH